MIIRGLIQLYHACLRLYPRRFRAEFSDEMVDIFAEAAASAAGQGPLALCRLCFSELVGFPVGLWRAHRAARAGTPAHALEGSGRELVLALAVFLLPAGMVLLNGEGSARSGLPAAGLFLGVMIFLGWLGGFPLWSLPYVGIILVVAGYLHLFQWVAGLLQPALISNLPTGQWDPSTHLLLEVASTGMVWLMLFCLTLLVVALLAVFNRFQPLFTRVRHDWTLLSYVLYGESVFVLVLLFGSHHSEPNYAISSLLCLLGGVWFFLRSPSRGQRLTALLACLTLAFGVAALERQTLFLDGRMILAWAWMVAALLLPGILTRLPPIRSTRDEAAPGKAQPAS
jgi:hypothetical protein